MVESRTSVPTDDKTDPFVLYARSLHDYTLGLWTETRRLTEERRRAQQLEASSMPSSQGGDQTNKKQPDQSSSSQQDQSFHVQT